MQAMAIDIRVPGVPIAQLRDAALALHRGGVGYYVASDFVSTWGASGAGSCATDY